MFSNVETCCTLTSPSSLVELQEALSSKANYVGNLRGPTTLCWKTSDREHVLVTDQLADPFVNPIILEMIGQVGRGGSSLKPHGSYNPTFKNFPKAKIAFELEMPTDAMFAADYLRGIAFLKRLERNARPSVEGRNLFLDSSAHSNVRFVAPLFRVKVRASVLCREAITKRGRRLPQRDDADDEEMPDDYISNDPGEPHASWTRVALTYPFQRMRPISPLRPTGPWMPSMSTLSTLRAVNTFSAPSTSSTSTTSTSIHGCSQHACPAR